MRVGNSVLVDVQIGFLHCKIHSPEESLKVLVCNATF
jgi:hypothetical protein